MSRFVTPFALLLGLCAGAALAQGKLQQKQEAQEAQRQGREQKTKAPQQPKHVEPPRTCEAQCKMMEQECTRPCKEAKVSPELQRECASDCVQFVSACRGSCMKHGYIDKRYMIENIKPPRPPGNIPVQRGGGDEE